MTLPPNEMGIVLGVAVLLDAFLVRPGSAPRAAPTFRTGNVVGPGGG